MDSITKVRRNIFLSPALDARLLERARAIGVRPNALLIMLLDQGLSRTTSELSFDYHAQPPAPSTHTTIQAPEHRMKKKKKTPTFLYIPPDYVMQDEGFGEAIPPDARPLPWHVTQRVGDYLSKDPDATPRTIAQSLGIPMWQATVGKQAFDTEWYGSQLEEIARHSKKRGAV